MLRFPLPPGLKIVSTTPSGPTTLLTLQCTLPLEIVDDLAETLDLAGRMTGSEKLGALLAAVTAECRSSWLPEMEARRDARVLLGGDVHAAEEDD